MLKFTDNKDGTITDNETGLMWQQEEPGTMTWANALSYCNDLSLGGQSDWRLPNVEELISIVDYTKYDPAIDTIYFLNTYASFYWSSTTNAKDTYLAWYVYFYDGYINYHRKSNNNYVRCVRDA